MLCWGFRLLERAEHPAADGERVGDRFHPRGPLGVLVVAGVGLLHPRGDDQVVVAELDPAAARPHRVYLRPACPLSGRAQSPRPGVRSARLRRWLPAVTRPSSRRSLRRSHYLRAAPIAGSGVPARRTRTGGHIGAPAWRSLVWAGTAGSRSWAARSCSLRRVLPWHAGLFGRRMARHRCRQDQFPSRPLLQYAAQGALRR